MPLDVTFLLGLDLELEIVFLLDRFTFCLSLLVTTGRPLFTRLVFLSLVYFGRVVVTGRVFTFLLLLLLATVGLPLFTFRSLLNSLLRFVLELMASLLPVVPFLEVTAVFLLFGLKSLLTAVRPFL